MTTALSRDRLDYISNGCSEVLTGVDSKVSAHETAVRKARNANQEDPTPDLPRVSQAHWVSWACGILDGAQVPAWFRDADLVDAFQDLAGPLLARLRQLPEFQTWKAETVEIRWTRKPIVVKDLVLTEACAGRVKVVPLADRLAWTGSNDAPSFRLELSLPWWLLATEDEQERGLHAVIIACGHDGTKPVLRKPDIVAHSATLARYGVSGIRQAAAVAHAQAHPSHTRILRDFGFDPETGQGLLWRGYQVERQGNLVDQVQAAKPKRGGRGKPPPLKAVEDLPDAEN